MKPISNSPTSPTPITAATDNTLRHLTFDNSLQASIITIAGNGKIIMANSAACKLLGYSKKALISKNSRSTIFDMKESSFKKMLKQRNTEGNSLVLATVIKKNNTRLPCELTSAVFMDTDGIKKAIISIKDMSAGILEQKNIDTEKEKIVANNIAIVKSKQKTIDQKKDKVVADNIIVAQAKSDAKLEVNNNWIKHIAKTSYDVMWDWDIITGKIYIGDSIEEVFGYKVQNNIVDFKEFICCLVPEEKDKVEKKLLKALASRNKSWKDSYMFKCKDGSIAFTTSRASIVRDEKGKALHLIGNMQDVSKVQELKKKLDEQKNGNNGNTDGAIYNNERQIELEEKLAQEIKLKGKQIADAMDEGKEAARSEIGKELHDNVNQLLGASRLYLDVAKQGGEDSELFLARSSDCTLIAIEEIRKLTKGLSTDVIKGLGLGESIKGIAKETMEVSTIKISCTLKNFTENCVNDKFKLNLFRIVQEQLNNILKHAKATKATISLAQNKSNVILSISDNGIGFDTTQKQNGIGISNIKSRAASYDGTADFISQPDKGCRLNVTIPIPISLYS